MSTEDDRPEGPESDEDPHEEEEEYEEEEYEEEYEDLVVLATFLDEHIAELARATLDSEGITAHVQRGMGSIFGSAFQANVLVSTDRVDEARRIIQEVDLHVPADSVEQAVEEELEEERGHRRLGRASKFVLGVAILYSLVGALVSLGMGSSVRTALKQIDQYGDDEIVPFTVLVNIRKTLGLDLMGVVPQTGSEVRERARGMRNGIILHSLLIAALFYGLYGWARKSPLPALIVSLCLFLVIEVGGGWRIIPASFTPAWIILISVIWVVGIQQALAERRAGGPRSESRSTGE